jgi:rod shape-determining protein MreB and related proteins
MSKDVLTIGMDLGASKTAVVASNGRREVLPSIVGWPKDQVARGMLGKDVLFGQEVLEQRLALHAIRPFERGMLKYVNPRAAGVTEERIERYKQAARLLVQHAVERVAPGHHASIRGVLGVPSRASLESQQLLLEAAETVFEQVAVIPEPFAVAYGVDRLQNTLVIDIGASTIDICPMCGTFPLPEEQQTVPMGGDAIDEEFRRRLGELYPEAQLSINMARDIKERYGSVQDSKDKVIVSLLTGSRREEFDLAEPLRAACQTIVEPLVEGVRQVLSNIDPDFRPAIVKNILLSGGGSQLRGLDRAIEAAFRPLGDVRATRVHDCLFAGASGAFKLAMAMGDQQWQVLYQVEKAETCETTEAAIA